MVKDVAVEGTGFTKVNMPACPSRDKTETVVPFTCTMILVMSVVTTPPFVPSTMGVLATLKVVLLLPPVPPANGTAAVVRSVADGVTGEPLIAKYPPSSVGMPRLMRSWMVRVAVVGGEVTVALGFVMLIVMAFVPAPLTAVASGATAPATNCTVTLLPSSPGFVRVNVIEPAGTTGLTTGGIEISKAAKEGTCGRRFSGVL